jgi:hypothetical protein
MKKFLSIMAALMVIFQSSCFWDEHKSNNNSLLLLALLNTTNTRFLVTTTSYSDAGDLQFNVEDIYPSEAIYLQSLKNDINATLFPTDTENYNLGGSISTKWSSAKGGDNIWFTSDDTFSSYTELKAISSTISRYIIYSDFSGTVSHYYEYQFDANGRVIKRTYYNNAGAIEKDSDNVAILDTTWTDDNNCSSIGYDSDGTTVTQRYTAKRDTIANTVAYVKFQSDGTTQVSATIYDYTNNRMVMYSTNMTTIIAYGTNTLNTFQEALTSTFYNGSGGDTTWFTGDDQILIYSELTYDSNGYQTGTSTYTDDSKTTRIGYMIITH